MAVNTTSTWEEVTTDGNFITKRLWITAGWIIRVDNTGYSTHAITFSPDPEHLWIPTNTDDS